jgi:hypothetical protein
MALIPHDTADLALAPVVLQLDREISMYSGLSQAEVEMRIAVEADAEPRTYPARRQALLRALTNFVDLHGWTVAINDRGLRLSHRDNAVTLGFPKSLRTYLEV